MTEKKAIKAVKMLKKYCKSFETCDDGCIFRNLNKYTERGCMFREGTTPEEYDEMTEGGEENGRAKEE